ncbi:MAG: hypothetical protein ACREOF_07375 [Gemmatimonadales bacterium]
MTVVFNNRAYPANASVLDSLAGARGHPLVRHRSAGAAVPIDFGSAG